MAFASNPSSSSSSSSSSFSNSSSSSSSTSSSSTNSSSSQLMNNDFISSAMYQGITKEALLSHDQEGEGSIEEKDRALPRSFVEKRIYNAFEKASSSLIPQGELLQPEVIQPIFTYIKFLPYDEKETNNGHTLEGLFTEIDNIRKSLKKLPSTMGFVHPYIPVLQQIKSTILQFVNATRPIDPFTEEKLTTTDRAPLLGAYLSQATSDSPSSSLIQGELKENERALPTIFMVNRILVLFQQTSALLGATHELIAQKEIEPLFTYMNNLPAEEKEDTPTIDGLFAQIDALEEKFQKRSIEQQHPYLSTLKKVRLELRNFFQVSNPSLEDSINKTQKERNAIIRNARREKAEDIICIFCCLCWTPCEKLLTCCNFSPICPEAHLPQARSFGTLYCNLFSPCNSISAFCEDITEQNQRIKEAKKVDAPQKQIMK